MRLLVLSILVNLAGNIPLSLAADSGITSDYPDVTISISGPAATDIATNSNDVTLINFTIASTADITFNNFPISLDTSLDSSNRYGGLLTPSGIANITDVKIVNTDTGDVVWGPVDANAFTTTLGGSTLISEANDSDVAYHIFTDDISMSAREVLHLSLRVDVRNGSALNGMTLFGSLALGNIYPEIEDGLGNILNNSDALVPVLNIVSKTMTVKSPSLNISLSSTPIGANIYAGGSKDVPFVGLVFTCGAVSDCTVTNLTLQGYYDDEGDFNDFDSIYDSSDHLTRLSNLVSNFYLVDYDNVPLSMEVNLNASTQKVAFGVNWTISAGDTEVVYLKGDLSPIAYSNNDAENIAFGLSHANYAKVQDEHGNSFGAKAGGSTTGSVNVGTPITYVTTKVINPSGTDLYATAQSVENLVFNYRLGNEGNVSVDTAILNTNMGTNYFYIDGINTTLLSQARWAWHRWSSDRYTMAGGYHSRLLPLYGYTAFLDLEAGTHTVSVCIDPTNVVAETDETNNCASQEFVYNGELPDVYSVVDSFDPTLGILNFTLGNNGEVNIWENYENYQISLNGNPYFTQAWVAGEGANYLKAGGIEQKTYTFPESTLFQEGTNTVKVCTDTKNVIAAETSETNNCASTTFVWDQESTLQEGTLAVSVDSSTPPEDIVIAGTSDVEVSVFTFEATGEAFLITDLSVNNLQDGILASDLGEYDNNISKVTLSYEDESGAMETASGYLVEGTAQFSGLELYVPKDGTANFTVYADLDSIMSSGSSATAGEFINLNLAFNNFEAIGLDSGNILLGHELNFGTLTYAEESASFKLDGAQTVSANLGDLVNLTINNGTDDNTHKLPLGSILCMDADEDGSCLSEDIYMVTAWPSSTAGSEDTVSVTMLGDSGDGIYGDNVPLLYALPGSGYLTETNLMWVYETKPTLSLSSKSPSGNHSLSKTDEAFFFNITADSHEDVELEELIVDMLSGDLISLDGDFVTTASVTAYLKDGGVIVASAPITFIDASHAEIHFDTPDVEIAAGSMKTYTVMLDTGLALNPDTGVDDPLLFSIDYGSSSNGVVTAGGMQWSDGNASVQWLGNVSGTRLYGNTLFY